MVFVDAYTISSSNYILSQKNTKSTLRNKYLFHRTTIVSVIIIICESLTIVLHEFSSTGFIMFVSFGTVCFHNWWRSLSINYAFCKIISITVIAAILKTACQDKNPYNMHTCIACSWPWLFAMSMCRVIDHAWYTYN